MPARKPTRGVLDMLVGQPWSIRDDAGRKLADAASVLRDPPTPAAMTEAFDAWLTGTVATTVRDGIASIPVKGVLFPDFTWWSWLFGGSTYAQIQHDVEVAHKDASVTAIVLVCDSPGGAVTGADETSRFLRDLRGDKPIVAYVAGECASACYWVASACDEIITQATGVLGSIGTAASFIDARKRMAREGLRRLEFVSRQSPNKWLDPAKPDGAAQLQAMLDDLADVMVATVAENRDVSVDTVLAEFGAGGLFVGEAAVTAGLADRLGTWESLRADLRADAALDADPDLSTPQEHTMPTASSPGRGRTRSASRGKAAAAATPRAADEPKDEEEEEEEPEEQPAAADEPPAEEDDDEEPAEDDDDEEDPVAEATARRATRLAKRYPQAVAHLRALAARDERARLASIDALARPGSAKLIAKCKADATCTPERAALALLTAESAGRTGYLAGRRNGEDALEKPSNRASARGDEGDDAAAVAQSILGSKPKASTASAR